MNCCDIYVAKDVLTANERWASSETPGLVPPPMQSYACGRDRTIDASRIRRPWVAALGLCFGLGLLSPCTFAQAFSPLLDLRSLFPAAGGDGTTGFVLKGIDSDDRSGSIVSGAGDVNGDGINDIIIGAHKGDPNGQAEAGESYVVFGRSTGFPASFDLSSLFPASGGDGSKGFVLQGVNSGDHAGLVRDAGDVNGDGIDDIIIGAIGADPEGRTDAGAGYVVFGRTTGFPAAFELANLRPDTGGDGTEGFVLEGARKGDHLGIPSGAGDINGDGIDDFIIAATQANPNGDTGAGEVYAVFGRTTGFPAAFDLRRLFPAMGGDGTEGFVLQGAAAGDRLRVSAIRPGDLNGDGVDDLLLGAEYADPDGRTDAGESYVVYGRTTGFPATFKISSLFPNMGGDGTEGFVLKGIGEFDTTGRTACGAGDVNGDGIKDFVIGGYKADTDAGPDAGESYLVYGRMTAFPGAFQLRSLYPALGGDGTEGFVMKGVDAGDRAFPVAIGDINSDGIDDMLVGAHLADAKGRVDAGASYVVYGRMSGFPSTFELRNLFPAAGGDGTEGFVIQGVDAGDELGYTLSGVGDVNGDGLDDLIIGSLYADTNGQVDAGESYVIFGRQE